MSSLNSLTPPLITMRDDELTVFGSGSDVKSLITPDAIRLSSAFVIHDPDGSLWNNCAMAFSNNNYVLKVLNLSNIKSSVRYNPIAYFNEEAGVYKLTNALINNTKGLGKPEDTDFVLCEIMLLNALLCYIHYEAPDYEFNIKSLIIMLEHMMIEDYQDGFISAVDYLFDEKGDDEPWHTSARLYIEFKYAAGSDEQAMRIAESCIARLAPFNTPEMIDFMSSDELRLDNLTSPNTALFIVDGDANEDIKLLVPLMYSQFFDAQHRKRGEQFKFYPV